MAIPEVHIGDIIQKPRTSSQLDKINKYKGQYGCKVAQTNYH